MLNSELECIYNNHFNRVLAYFSKRLPIAMDAEDLTADTFVYALSHIDQYDPEKSPISAWIFLIASSRLKNYYRDKYPSFFELNVICYHFLSKLFSMVKMFLLSSLI